MTSCVFCEIVSESSPCYKVYEDERHLGILDINPIRDGHILLIPKRHDAYVFNLKEVEYLNLFKIAKLIVPHLQTAFGAERIGMLIGGISISHIHIHLIPTYHSRDIDPNLAKPASREVLLAVQERILATFK